MEPSSFSNGPEAVEAFIETLRQLLHIVFDQFRIGLEALSSEPLEPLVLEGIGVRRWGRLSSKNEVRNGHHHEPENGNTHFQPESGDNHLKDCDSDRWLVLREWMRMRCGDDASEGGDKCIAQRECDDQCLSQVHGRRTQCGLRIDGDPEESAGHAFVDGCIGAVWTDKCVAWVGDDAIANDILVNEREESVSDWSIAQAISFNTAEKAGFGSGEYGTCAHDAAYRIENLVLSWKAVQIRQSRKDGFGISPFRGLFDGVRSALSKDREKKGDLHSITCSIQSPCHVDAEHVCRDGLLTGHEVGLINTDHR